MPYSRTNWINNSAPALNQSNLNKIELALYDVYGMAEASVRNRGGVGGLYAGTEANRTNVSAIAQGDLYYAYDTGAIYRWDGSAWALLIRREDHYTKAQADGRFAPLSHSHDDRYYTQAQADSRFEQTSRKGQAGGYASLDTNARVPLSQLGGITDAQVAANATIAESKLSLASDAAANVPSRRTLGTGAQQAAPGNHNHDSSYVPLSRQIATTGPLQGGGALSADRTISILSASETQSGAVQLATAAEAQAGTVTSKAVHPAGLRSALDAYLPKALGAFRVYKSTNQTVAPGTIATIAWQATDFDVSGGVQLSNNRYVIPAGMDGVWHFQTELAIQGGFLSSGSDANIVVQVRKNGATLDQENHGLNFSGRSTTLRAIGRIQCAAGDTIDIALNFSNTNSTNNLTVLSGQTQSSFEGHYLGRAS